MRPCFTPCGWGAVVGAFFCAGRTPGTSSSRPSRQDRPISVALFTTFYHGFGCWRDGSGRRFSQRPIRDPDIAVGIDQIGFPQAMGLVRGFGQSEEHTSELQSLAYLVCRLLLEQ